MEHPPGCARWTCIHQVTIGNLSRPPQAVFLDLVLPQMVPHQRVREQRVDRQLTGHFLSRITMLAQGGAPLPRSVPEFPIPLGCRAGTCPL